MTFKSKRKQKDFQLRRNFNISIEEYEEMLKNQQNCCAICWIHISHLKKKLAVDHCHKTNKIRGLLCQSCNVGLGQFEDSGSLLRAAADYSDKYK